VAKILDPSLILDAPELRAERARLERGVYMAARETVAEAARALELDLEEATKGAAKGNLFRAWKSQTFPRSGPARAPVGTVFVNGGVRSRGAISFLTVGGRVRGKAGQWLAIPTAAAGGGARGFRTGRSFTDLTPEEWERRNGAKLRFVPGRRGRAGRLVLDEGRLAGKKQLGRLAGERARASGRTVTVTIFILVPFVEHANKIAVEPLIRRAEGRLGPDFVRRVEALP
jgi:hypothetical protein